MRDCVDACLSVLVQLDEDALAAGVSKCPTPRADEEVLGVIGADPTEVGRHTTLHVSLE